MVGAMPRGRGLASMQIAVLVVSALALVGMACWFMYAAGSFKVLRKAAGSFKAYSALLTKEGQVLLLGTQLLPRPQEITPPPSRMTSTVVKRVLLCLDLGQGGGGLRVHKAAQRMADTRLPAGSVAVLADQGACAEEGGAVTVLLARKALEWEEGEGPAAPGPSGIRAEGAYELEAGDGRIRIWGEDERGLYYGLGTLLQILVLRSQVQPSAWLSRGGWVGLLGDERLPTGISVPPLRIRDWPAIANRGVMLDISRNRVHSAATLRHVADLLAATKMSQLQLYMEHTFAYEGHELVWNNTGALTRGDVEELSEYCHERFIELVPNQQSFGHLHHWLKHPSYRHLAENPAGQEKLHLGAFCCSMWDDEPRIPYSLAPTAASLALLSALYAQLIPAFPHASAINVGLDEVFDLGKGVSRKRVKVTGRRTVWKYFLLDIHKLLRPHNRTMQFWGDVPARDPSVVRMLPRDAVVLEWGYEAGSPVFQLGGSLYQKSGLRFYNCPGTSSWDSIGGRVRNAIANIFSAADAALEFGAEGLLVTDWGDNGHLQPLPVSYPGLLSAADFSWNVVAAREAMRTPKSYPPRLASAIDSLVLADRAGVAGAVLLDLGMLYLRVGRLGAHIQAVSALFSLLVLKNSNISSPEVAVGLDITSEGLAEGLVELGAHLRALALSRSPDALALREITWVVRVLSVACRIGQLCMGLLGGELNSRCDYRLLLPGSRAVGEELRGLVGELREIWPLRAAVGQGLDDSAARLMHTVGLLLGEAP